MVNVGSTANMFQVFIGFKSGFYIKTHLIATGSLIIMSDNTSTTRHSNIYLRFSHDVVSSKHLFNKAILSSKTSRWLT